MSAHRAADRSVHFGSACRDTTSATEPCEPPFPPYEARLREGARALLKNDLSLGETERAVVEQEPRFVQQHLVLTRWARPACLVGSHQLIARNAGEPRGIALQALDALEGDGHLTDRRDHGAHADLLQFSIVVRKCRHSERLSRRLSTSMGINAHSSGHSVSRRNSSTSAGSRSCRLAPPWTLRSHSRVTRIPSPSVCLCSMWRSGVLMSPRAVVPSVVLHGFEPEAA